MRCNYNSRLKENVFTARVTDECRMNAYGQTSRILALTALVVVRKGFLCFFFS